MGQEGHLFGRYVDAAGRISGELSLDPPDRLGSYVDPPHLACDPRGNFTAVWTALARRGAGELSAAGLRIVPDSVGGTLRERSPLRACTMKRRKKRGRKKSVGAPIPGTDRRPS